MRIKSSGAFDRLAIQHGRACSGDNVELGWSMPVAEYRPRVACLLEHFSWQLNNAAGFADNYVLALAICGYFGPAHFCTSITESFKGNAELSPQ